MQNKVDREFGFWGKPIFVIVFILLWVLLLILFRTLPEIDLSVAQFFYDSGFCERASIKSYCLDFPIAQHPVFAPIREVLNYTPHVIGVLLLVLIIKYAFQNGWPINAAQANRLVVFISLLVGPLFIVNLGLKTYFGRVRPRDIELFGGQFDFTAAGDFAGQCASNCSFVSGEASVGGWFLCLGLLVATPLRRFAYPALLALGVFMALLRVAFGAHFISDVVLGYLLSVIVICLVAIVTQYFLRAKAPV